MKAHKMPWLRIVLGSMLYFTCHAGAQSPPWSGVSYGGRTVILRPGIAVATHGMVSNVATVPATERWMVDMINVDGILPVSGRTDVTSTTQIFHHASWHVDQIGNVYGVAINTKTADGFVTASSNYGSGYFGEASILKYGTMSGGGADSVVSAGRVYKIDAVTGAASVFAVLPQVLTSITHTDCEYGDPVARTTGVGLGNIAYDAVNDQFFVSNMEDGRIYRLSAAGPILDSYDPGVYDDGTAGIKRSGVVHAVAIEDLAYGLVVDGNASRLYFGGIDATTGGTGGAPGIYSIDLQSGGGFSGVVNNTWRPTGATWDNYVEGTPDTEYLHTTIPTQGNSTYASNTVYFVSDLSITPSGDLLAGIRVGCDSSFYTSYNYQGETSIVAKGSGGKYDGTITQLDVSVEGDAGNEDAYGGVSFYETADGSGDVLYVMSSGDVLTEAGPHGIVVVDSTDLAGSIDPLAVVSYGVSDDPMGIGGDVEVFSLPRLGVGNLVFNDLDGDGTFSGGDVPLEGVYVYLFNTGDSPSNLGLAVDSDTTDVDGHYLLETTTAGNYFVHIPPAEFGSGEELEGFLSTTGAGSDDGTDDDGDENGVDAATPATTGISTGTVALTFGTEPVDAAETGDAGDTDSPDKDTDLTIDFAFRRSNLGDLVWNDLDQDGIQDPGEPGFPGVTVSLHASNGTAITCSRIVEMEADDFDPSGGLSGSDVTGGHWDTHAWSSNTGSGNVNVVTDVDGYAMKFAGTRDVSRPLDLSACDPGSVTMRFDYRLAATEVVDTYKLEYETSGGWQTGSPLWSITGGTNSSTFQTVNVSVPDSAIAIRFKAGGSFTDDLMFVDNVSLSCQMIAPVTKVTDGEGRYHFDPEDCLIGGTAYKIRVDMAQAALSGYSASLLNQGGDDTKDSDGVVGGGISEIAVTAPVSSPDSDRDFGFYDSTPCQITALASTIVRDSKGTPAGSDDTFTFDVTVAQQFASASWTSDNAPASGSYGVAVGFGPFDVTEGDVTIDFADAVETDCTDSVTVTVPPEPCVITASIVGMQVQDQGTPLTTDDTFTFDVNVTAVNASAGWTSDSTPASGTYGVTATFGPYLISGGSVTVNFADSVDAGCTDQRVISGPEITEMSLGNLVYEDLDQDGVFDFNFDLGALGVTVELYTPGGNGQPGGGDDILVTSTTTGSAYPLEGCFRFEHLSPGTYFMKIPASEFANGEPLHGLISIPGNDGDTGVDDDAGENGVDGSDPTVSGVWTNVITLVEGMEPDDSGTETGECADLDPDDFNGDMTVDFGFTLPPVGIGNLVFIDVNADGDYDAGTDTPVEDVTVKLFAAGDNPAVATPIDEQETDVNGCFELSCFDPGTTAFFVYIPPSEFGAADDGDGDAGELYGYLSVPGSGVAAEDDDSGEDGLDSLRPDTYGIRTAQINLVAGSAPLDAAETGKDGSGDDDDDSYDYTVDLGFVSESATVGVGNLIFFDSNRNGQRDTAEAGVVNVTVELFTAANPPGSGSAILTTQTDSSGGYAFSGLNPGSYVVHLPGSNFSGGPLAGYLSSTGQGGDSGIDDDADENGIDSPDPVNGGISSSVIALAATSEPVDAGTETGLYFAGDNVADSNIDFTVDFGFATVEINLVGIGNLLFEDKNGDGDFDSGTESGIDGVLLHLFGTGDDPLVDTPVQSTFTVNGGRYYFGSLPPGSYFVFIPPAAFASNGLLTGYSSSPGVGGDNGTDDDGDENGIDQALPATFGIRTGDILLSTTGEPVDAGTETGHFRTSDNADDDSVDLTVDIGLTPPLGIGNLVFNDLDGDGKFEPLDGETGIDNVTVQLYRAADPIGSPLNTTTTAGGGCYAFNDLPEGTYYIHIPAVEFAPGGDLQTKVSSTGAGGDDGIDDDAGENGIDEADPSVTGIRSADIVLSNTMEPTGSETGKDGAGDDAMDSNVDYTVDFAMVESGLAVGIGNLVFYDLDGDGKFEPLDGETGVDGVTVALYLASAPPGFGSAIASTTTAGGGCYYFGGLVGGNYIVHLPAVNFTTGGVLQNHTSTPGVGLDDGVDDSGDENGSDPPNPASSGLQSVVIALAATTEPTDAGSEDGKAASSDNALDSNNDLTVDFGFVELVAVGNYVFFDVSGDGKFETAAGDFGINGVKVQLFKEGGVTPHKETTTTAGQFIFDRLLPGNYFVSIPSSEFQPTKPLVGVASSLGADGTDSVDDDVSENGMDVPGIGTDVRTALFSLQPGLEPSGESGEGSYAGTLPDANVNLTIDFGFSGDGDGDSIPDVDDSSPTAFDPHGYLFNEDTCEIVTGGSIAVTGPGDVFVQFDGSTGAYQWFVTRFDDPVNGGVFTMTYTPPSDYLMSNARSVTAPATYAVPTGPTPVFRGSGDGDTNGFLDDCTEVANPYNFVFEIEPTDAFVFNNNIPLRTAKGGKYADFAYDHSVLFKTDDVNPLNDLDAPDDNPDGDLYNNALEYALCLHPGSGANAKPFTIGQNPGTGTVDASFFRLRGGFSDVTYTLQSAFVLGNPTSWTDEIYTPFIDTVSPDVPANAEKVVFDDLEAEIANAGFVRLKIEIAGDATGPHYTEVCGWRGETVPAEIQSYSFPYTATHVFSGSFTAANVSGGSNELIDVSDSAGTGAQGVAAQLASGKEYYLEMLSGSYEGHRLEVDEAATTAQSITLDSGNLRDTLDPIPGDLAGVFAIRAHHTIADILPTGQFTANNNSALGDQALLFTGGMWQVLWVYDDSGNIDPPQWTDSGNSSLSDVGDTVIEPGKGFFTRPRAGSVDLVSTGVVRSWKFACPLVQGYNMVGTGYPFDQSPADRVMLRDASDGEAQNYFTADSSPINADQILVWLGDEVAGVEGYRTYYNLYVPSTVYDYWTDQTNSSLTNQNAAPLFKNQRALFFDMEAAHDRSVPAEVWGWPAKWAP